jgi:hypothetical protein
MASPVQAVEKARGKLDGALFLVMHLLKLREQVASPYVNVSHRRYLSLSFRKSTLPRNRQLVVYYY